MKSIVELSKIQREILRKIIVENPKRPSGESFESIYRMLNYEKHTEDEARSALEGLVTSDYLIQKSGSYSLSRDSFFHVKKHFKWWVFLNDRNLFPMVTISFGVLAIIIASFTTFTLNKETPTKNSSAQIASNTITTVDSITEINDRLKKVEDILLKSKNVTHDNNSVTPVKGIEIRIATLEKSLAEYNEAFSGNPTKAVQLSGLRSDLDNLKAEHRLGQQSLSREIDRISSYNTTIIIFMITFMVGFLGLGIINYFRRKDD